MFSAVLVVLKDPLALIDLRLIRKLLRNHLVRKDAFRFDVPFVECRIGLLIVDFFFTDTRMFHGPSFRKKWVKNQFRLPLRAFSG